MYLNKLTLKKKKKNFLRSHTDFWPVVFSLEESKEVEGRKRDKMEEEIRIKNIFKQRIYLKKRARGELKNKFALKSKESILTQGEISQILCYVGWICLLPLLLTFLRCPQQDSLKEATGPLVFWLITTCLSSCWRGAPGANQGGSEIRVALPVKSRLSARHLLGLIALGLHVSHHGHQRWPQGGCAS